MNSARRSGRRAGRTETRARILKSARKLFARRGFDGASLRAVAGNAGVDPALVVHFFGSKAELFAATLTLPFELSELELLLRGERATMGRRIAEFYLQRIFHERADTVLSLLRSSVTNPDAAATLRRTIESTAVALFEQVFRGADAKLRAELVASHMIGVFLARYILRIEPLASLDEERLIEIVAPALQRYLTAPLKRGRR